MNPCYAHIIFDEDDYFSPKKAIFDNRTKTGFLTTWSQNHAEELLQKKHWKCLSAFGMESSILRQICFERKHSRDNLLYFKYIVDLPDAVETCFDYDIVNTLASKTSLREITEEVVGMLSDYDAGKLSFSDGTLNKWLNRKTRDLEISGAACSDSYQQALMKYVENFVSKILWQAYSGNLRKLASDSSAIVFLFTEMCSFSVAL
ncbi:MAG TPA: hypothetical protein DCE14_03945 [Kosmotogaceae bacterium]|nr:MAG: Uncharacterized protein XE05_0105 [Thermotogales bacterium 46_20]HAA85487.1 hypothetical protein [Kosmotogaceae bacterium]